MILPPTGSKLIINGTSYRDKPRLDRRKFKQRYMIRVFAQEVWVPMSPYRALIILACNHLLAPERTVPVTDPEQYGGALGFTRALGALKREVHKQADVKYDVFHSYPGVGYYLLFPRSRVYINKDVKRNFTLDAEVGELLDALENKGVT